MDLSSAKVGEIYWLYLSDENPDNLAEHNKTAAKLIAATIIADPGNSSDFLVGWKEGELRPIAYVRPIDLVSLKDKYPTFHPNLNEFTHIANVSHYRKTAGIVNVAIPVHQHSGGCTCACGYFNEYAVPNSNGKYVCSQCKMFKSVFA